VRTAPARGSPAQPRPPGIGRPTTDGARRTTEDAIDAVDEQLIGLLRENGRASYAEMARQVGLSSPAVHERVAKLEAAGVITGYRAAIEPTAVGLDVTALMSVIESDSIDDSDVEAALREVPGLEDCWRVAGAEDYVVKVRVPDMAYLERTINAVNRIRGVARTRTTVVLSTKWEDRHG
jgi:Lrp/AsnC family transcriptional regulator, leucine-responsive regulatory protein